MKYFILILCFFLFSIVAKADENNFFMEAKNLFDKKNMKNQNFYSKKYSL